MTTPSASAIAHEAASHATSPERLLELAQSREPAVRDAAQSNPNLSTGALRVWLALGSPFAWSNPQRPLAFLAAPPTIDELRGLPKALANARIVLDAERYQTLMEQTRPALEQWWKSEHLLDRLLEHLAAQADKQFRSPSHLRLVREAIAAAHAVATLHEQRDVLAAIAEVEHWCAEQSMLRGVYAEWNVGEGMRAPKASWELVVQNVLLLTLDPHMEDAPSNLAQGLFNVLTHRDQKTWHAERVAAAKSMMSHLCDQLRTRIPEPPLA